MIRIFVAASILTAVAFGQFKFSPGAACGVAPCVTTFHNDNSRDGVNGSETALTPTNVAAGGFSLLTNFDNLDGLVYAQPLYLSGVTMANSTSCAGTKRNIAIVATENNSIYVYDVTSPKQIRLCYSTNSNAAGEFPIPYTDLPGSSPACNNVVPQEGITGTPVIDFKVTPPTLYFVSAVRLPTMPTTWDFKLNVMTLNDGKIAAGTPFYLSKLITSQIGGTAFSALYQNQRTGMALYRSGAANTVNLYFGFGSHCDSKPFSGYVTGFQFVYGSPSTLDNLGVFNTENVPGGAKAGIWMSGEAPPIDVNGHVYVATGNGPWVGKVNNPAVPAQLGESVVQLSQSGSTLTPVDYYTPNDYSMLNVGSCPNGNCNSVCVVNNTASACPAQYLFNLKNDDWDLGAGGVTLINPVGGTPSVCGAGNGELVAGGKEGVIYGVCYNSKTGTGGVMGGLDSCGYNYTSACKTNLTAVATQTACTQASAPAPGAIAQCFYATPNLPQQDNDDATGNRGTPAFWAGSAASPQNFLYIAGVADSLRAYPYVWDIGSFDVTNVAVSSHPASFEYPGATPSVSWNANATTNPNGTALVWTLNSSAAGSLTMAAKAATLFAHTAVPSPAQNSTWTLVNDFAGDKLSLPPGVNAGPGAVKFTVPTIAGGMVFVGGGAANPKYYFPGPSGSGTNCTPTYGGGSCLGALYIYGISGQ